MISASPGTTRIRGAAFSVEEFIAARFVPEIILRIPGVETRKRALRVAKIRQEQVGHRPSEVPVPHRIP